MEQPKGVRAALSFKESAGGKKAKTSFTKMEQPKGVRDFLPREKLVRDYVVQTLKKVFEKFGYSPLETPALELLSVATAKGGTQPGTDAYKEIYKLTDQANRQLVLRYELTFPLARVMAMNPQLPKPFKRYQIGEVWRDGPTKLGRYREFWQCDVDVVGSSSMLADAEILAMYTEVFEKFGLKADIRVSSRKFLKGILEYAGIPESLQDAATISIDKLEKFGRDAVIKDAGERGVDEDSMIKALDILEQEGTTPQIMKQMKYLLNNNKLALEGLQELEQLFQYAKSLGARDLRFVPSLARGLSYYTGPIYEAYLKSGKLGSSLAGGGRWDNMVGEFIGSKEKIPATGTTFGLDTIYDALLIEKKITPKETVIQLYIIPIQTINESLSITREFRSVGINIDLDIMGRSISKNLSFCNSQKIPFAVFVGQKELNAKKIKLRDMKTGKEQLLTVRQAIAKLR